MNRFFLPTIFAAIFAGSVLTPKAYALDPTTKEEREKREKERKAKFARLRKEANAGKPVAMLELANCYYLGRLTKQDYDRAFKWYSEAAKRGNGTAYFNMGNCYFHGNGVNADDRKAYEYYTKAVSKGISAAIMKAASLADRFEKFDEARFFYEMGAKNEELSAISRLAFFYEKGIGGPINTKKSVEYYIHSAKKGIGLSQFKIAMWYNQGMNVKRDQKESLYWLQIAADNNVPQAMNLIGHSYLNGWGVKKDSTLAIKWFSKAADQGNAAAMVALGDCYAYGRGVEQDMVKSFAFYSVAAKEDDAQALYRVGFSYDRGLGVATDKNKAMENYARSAQLGSSQGQLICGKIFKEGRFGAQKNPSQAILWFQKAALQNNAEALYLLGRSYLYGEGVDKNRKRAKQLLSRAKKMDFPEAVDLYYDEFK